MYLTRFRMNTARLGARKLLGSPQALHAAVMAGFPRRLPDEAGGRILWRLDRNARAEVLLFVVSPDKPDYTHLVEQAGWPTAEEGWQTKEYGPFLDGLKEGEVWAFRLTANPVHHIRTSKEQKETKPTAHVTWRRQMDWLLQRQERGGFRIVERPAERRRLPEGDEHDLVVRDRRRVAFSKRRSGGKPVELAMATYDGRLEIADADALRRTLTQGLGRAKAYGCGLMTLAPADRADR